MVVRLAPIVAEVVAVRKHTARKAGAVARIALFRSCWQTAGQIFGGNQAGTSKRAPTPRYASPSRSGTDSAAFTASTMRIPCLWKEP